MVENFRVLVCCMARQENNYIREWVEHYYNLGFDNVLIFDNNEIGGENLSDVIGDYISSGFVIIEDYRTFDITKIECTKHTYCLTKGYKDYGKNYDWILFVDCDEFLELEYDQNVKEFLKRPEFRAYGSIKLNWKNYTDSNLVRVVDNDYSMKRFTEVLPKENWRNTEIKSFIRGNLPQVKQVSAHGSGDIPSCDVNGEYVDQSLRWDCHIKRCIWEKAWINHYRTKTLEEFIDQKMKRGLHGCLNPKNPNLSNQNSNQLVTFFEFNEKTKEKLDYLKSRGIEYN